MKSATKKRKGGPGGDKRENSEERRRGKTSSFIDQNSKSWENKINSVETIEEAEDPKTGERVRQAYVTWNNGQRTRHPLHMLHEKAPQKV